MPQNPCNKSFYGHTRFTHRPFTASMSKLAHMTTTQLTSIEIARILHTVFDEQIINYGAYNLVLATGDSSYSNPDVASAQKMPQECFLIGYRDTPRELIVAPVTMPEVTSGGPPTSIDNTNAVTVGANQKDQLILETTNGTHFVLSFTPHHEFACTAGTGVLDQTLDLDDFAEFLKNSSLLEQL